MGIQKQIDNLKSKLQETQDRRKRQEDLIMKVENLALKVRDLRGSLLSHVLSRLIQVLSWKNHGSQGRLHTGSKIVVL